MSKAMSLSPAGLLAVDCVTCKRRVRVSDYGDYPLSRAMADVGWTLTDQGKWRCDACAGGPAPSAHLEPGWVRCPRGCGIVVEACELCVTCSVCPRCCDCGQFVPCSDAQATTQAYDLETVARVYALAHRLQARGSLILDGLLEVADACVWLRSALTRRSQEGL